MRAIDAVSSSAVHLANGRVCQLTPIQVEIAETSAYGVGDRTLPHRHHNYTKRCRGSDEPHHRVRRTHYMPVSPVGLVTNIYYRRSCGYEIVY